MKRTAILASVLVLSLVACKKKEGDDSSAKPADKPAAPAPPPPPFTGKLTVERVLASKDIAPTFMPWAEGLARLKGQLGEPTRVKGDKYEWAVLEGDVCAYTYVTKEAGEKYKQTGEIVGESMSPMKVGKDELPGNRAQCMEVLGVTPGPPEDPNAAAPPTDGTAVTADVFRTTALAGRSKWKDQKVAVSGVYTGLTTSTSGSDAWTTVSFKASKDDTGKSVTCSLPKNAPAPTFEADAAVVATGTVKIKEWTSMGGGEVTLEPSLDECTIEVAKAK